MKIVNLTPHDIVVGDVTIPASGTIARCATITEPLDVPGCPVPVVRQYFGAVEGLPAPTPETMYVVSMVCAQAVGDSRDDVYIPGEQIRDEDGKIIGCKSIARLVPPPVGVSYQPIRGFLEWSFGAGCQGVDSFAAKYDLQVSTVERLIRGDRFTPEEAREVNMKIYDKLVDNLFSCRLDS